MVFVSATRFIQILTAAVDPRDSSPIVSFFFLNFIFGKTVSPSLMILPC